MSELSEKYKSNVKLVRDLVKDLGYELKTIENTPYTSFETLFRNVNGKEMMFKIICHYDSIRVVVVIDDETSVPEFTQTQVHRVRDAIQPSHPQSPPSPPSLNPSQHQSLPMSQLFV